MPAKWCPYCSAPTSCGAELSAYACTRAEGHSGDHVACSTEEHVIAAWPAEALPSGLRLLGTGVES
jgi:hypothetical protein